MSTMFCTPYDSTTFQCDKTHSDSVHLYIQWKTADLDLELLGTASHQQAKKGLTATPRTKLMTIKKQGGRLGLGFELFKHFVRFSYHTQKNILKDASILAGGLGERLMTARNERDQGTWPPCNMR